jgi:hypothetical protein
VDIRAGHVQLVPFSILPHPLDGLPHCLEVAVVPGPITPSVFVLLVELHGVGWPGTEVDQLEAIVGGQVGEESVSVGVCVGQG